MSNQGMYERTLALLYDARTRSNARGPLLSPRPHESCGGTHRGRVEPR